MTNTRITDAEVFERRYPVILREFSLRSDSSGGQGEYRGGEGVVRDIEFRIEVQVSILSERRVFRPYGLEGGGEGKCGVNLWVRRRRSGGRRMGGRGRGGDEGNGNDKDGLFKGEQQGEKRNEKEEEEEEQQIINLGGKNTATMQPGERIIVITPGGGGWGRVASSGDDKKSTAKTQRENSSKAAASWQRGSWAARVAM